MESIRVTSLVLMCLIMFGVVVEQSNASFQNCYKNCFLLCVIKPDTKPDKSVFSCTFKCLKDCAFPQSALDHCKLGCAFSSCNKISSKDNPGEDEMEKCVDSCFRVCAENY